MRVPVLGRGALTLPLFGCLLALVGCELFPHTPMSTVHPETEVADEIQSIYELITWWVLGIFIVVEAVLFWAVFRYRKRPGEEGVPAQVHGNTPVEILWTIFPIIPIVLVMVPTLQATCALQQPPAAEKNPLTIEVVGKQWWWEFRYPEEGIVTANELHIPVNRLVNLEVTSDNVIHSFWVPALAGKRDMVPGRSQRIWFTPRKTGEYQGQCAELCGPSHANMRLKVFVDSEEDYAEWVAKQKAPADTSMSDPGFTAFLQSGCIACHAIDFPGSPAQIDTGPNLTHVGSRATIAGGILENTPQNMKRWIRNAEAIKPGQKRVPNGMLVFEHLPEETLDTLVAFLQGLE